VFADPVPQLEGEAAAARDYRGGHLQIIASAGSGKTEVVSQRVAALLANEIPASAIVAFTFTERAAASLKARIERCILAHPKLGQPALDRIGGMFVGTIHSYCFRILQQHVAKYETFDVLDDHRLIAFLTREYNRIGIKQLDGQLFKSIATFRTNLEVIENELLEPDQLDAPFREIYETYLDVLEDNRFLTFGQQIARAVKELQRADVYEEIHGPLRHLIVDEYQDVNPAQERLVELLSADPVHVCVVGDDDQSIYQWRGADVSNIVEFHERYAPVERFSIDVNRRSRPTVIDVANGFGTTIQKRIPKTMQHDRASSGVTEVISWSSATNLDEAQVIAQAVRRAHDELGYRYRDVAVLVRSWTSLPVIVDALEQAGVPVQPGGRTGLFLQPEADLFGRTLAWLVDHSWRTGDRWNWEDEGVDIDDLVARYADLFELNPAGSAAIRAHLKEWKLRVHDDSKPANLVRELYDLIGKLGVDEWDFTDPVAANRLGTLARCSQLLADYEAARRRARPDHENPGEMKAGQDRGEWYYKWLAIYVQNWARGAYEGFEGEEDIESDAVDLTTIHQAKGLEWPLVFVPALTSKRFPSSMTGTQRDWRISTTLFNRTRYEGVENDERRLFYVAMTRARDFLSLSTFERISQKQTPSPFLLEVANGSITSLAELPAPPSPEPSGDEQGVLEITFSELAQYRECGMQFRLRTLIGFQPPLVPELGYGKAVHHVLREVAQFVGRLRRVPNEKDLDRLFDEGFYLPAANRFAHREMRRQARALVERYLSEWEDDLHRVWEVERPFELHLGGVTVVGRADVIVDHSNGEERLSIVDYKTAAAEGEQHGFQLQVYTDAGRREGLTVERAFVHDLRNASRLEVDVAEPAVVEAEDLVVELTDRLRARFFEPEPDADRCSRCDVKLLCKARDGTPRQETLSIR
jgi:DNA helicase-2/ATP-dependent DNA helicase PcrA